MYVDFSNLRGELSFNESLSKYTSWRVGGIAQCFYRPADKEDLAEFLSQLPVAEPILWLGLGSNLLVRDGGFPGTVIATAGILQSLEVEANTLIADVGVYCSKLAKMAARHSLAGAAFFAGIPGTLGGALAMNAGAHGVETWSLVTQVTTIDRQGEYHQRSPDEYTISYRHVEPPAEEWFISAKLVLEEGDKDSETAEIKSLLKRRNATQPTNQPCAGSVFRNPENDFAGRLIETEGLKGLTVGGAQVSEKHANFIVNTGSATAADIEALILLVQQKIEVAHGVRLQPEVHIVGEVA